ncbi:MULTISPECIES: hypothetical protein [unclassified Nocardiopsis]|uniref:hypothetical protein n=1 Tax=unclassified Nocardiopsis TaxID=2649073 RepID=UPI00135BA493|nr:MULTISPECIES: hypothetical protein [unclassified Nocardiopsis]
MSGVHGLTSASGVRSAVLPAPVRRALLLAALLCGVLGAAWLASAEPARAGERPDAAAVQGAQGNRPETAAAPAGAPAAQSAQGRSGSDHPGQKPSGQGGSQQQSRPEQAAPSQSAAPQAAPSQQSTASRSTAPQGGSRPETADASAGQRGGTASRAGEARSTVARSATAGTARAEDVRAEAASRVPATSAVSGPDTPLTGTVAAVGQGTTRMLFDSSVPAAVPTVGPGNSDVAQHVRDALEGATNPGGRTLPWQALAHGARGTDDCAGTSAEPGRRSGPAREAAATESRGAAPGLVPLHTAVTATAQAPDEAAPQDGTEPFTAEASSPVTSTVTGTSGAGTASGGAAGGTAVAGYLPATGAPAPAPGQVQAAWHVLRSVPAESADEPTFSPD